MKHITLLLAGLIVFSRTGAQNPAVSETPMQIGLLYAVSEVVMPPIYEGNILSFFRTNFTITFDIQVFTPVKVKYSLYTFKKTFPQDGKRNYLQGIRECGLVNPITTQADIDKNLDKIYEFPVVTETASGQKELPWDGYTDPKFTGQKYPVRDCLYMAAHNAETGELIDTQGSSNNAQSYGIYSNPGILYRIDEQKDNNGKVVKETLSGKVIVAYDDTRPIGKISALITRENCGFGAVSFEVSNQGADAIVADINRRIPGDVVAHITLTNPTVAPDNKDIKMFEWKDIRTEGGKDFIPDLANNSQGYMLAIIIDTDEMTYTGINNGYIWDGKYSVPPVPRNDFTDIESIKKSEISITSDGNGFIVHCPAGVSAKNYVVYDLVGRALKTGNLFGTSSEIITAAEFRSGICFVQLTVNENGKEKTVTKKVIKQ